jgi:hypothetical protein
MFRIAAEFQDVPLRETHVFEHLPTSVWEAIDFATTCVSGKIGDKIIE